jgi:hypothetical protein
MNFEIVHQKLIYEMTTFSIWKMTVNGANNYKKLKL